MGSKKVTVDELADAIVEELEAYDQEVTDGLKKSVKDVAKDCVKDIKSGSPVRTGSYSKGWRVKKMYESDTDIRLEIHNATDYQKAHLLEHGHAKRGGGRVEGKPHIGPAAEKAEKALLNKVKVVVKG